MKNNAKIGSQVAAALADLQSVLVGNSSGSVGASPSRESSERRKTDGKIGRGKRNEKSGTADQSGNTEPGKRIVRLVCP